MRKLFVEGGHPLKGVIRVSGAKNAVLKLMAAALLGHGRFVIRNVPEIRDVFTMLGVLQALGVEATLNDSTIFLNVETVRGEAPVALVQEMRASIQVMGPLLARLGWVRLSKPGGCAIGDRPIDLHLKNFKKLGAQIREEHGFITASTNGLVGKELYLDFPSVGATENLMMAATLAQGTTVIHNAAREPEIVDIQNFINLMGARVYGAGTSTITIKGVTQLGGADYAVIPDRIEAGSYLIAAAITRGAITIEHVIPQHLTAIVDKLQETGTEIKVGTDTIAVRGVQDLFPINILTQPYPGFATDLQPQYMALMTLAGGSSVIKETVYTNRFRQVEELRRMGADILLDSNAAVIKGVPQLSSALVHATDLRAGAALVLAGLAASGITEITGLDHIDRGYEKLVHKLQTVGGRIWRED